jgi:predicted DNA-binding antitoxin AbrB/MazE fold protein
MSITLDAIYENGLLRPLSPLSLPEHTRVRGSVEDLHDEDRAEWMAESRRRLTAVWDNDGDDVFHELLAP